jgi:hypothetical protein
VRHFNRWIIAAALCPVVLAIAVPWSVSAYKRMRRANERARLHQFLNDPSAGDLGWIESPELANQESRDDEEEGDDPRRRSIAARMLWGLPTPETTQALSEEARKESQRWAHMLPRPPSSRERSGARTEAVTGQSWVNLGPTDARFQWNGTQYLEVDSGRVSGILVHPFDPQQVIISTSGGGLWKTFNFGAPTPTWHAMGDTLGNLAIGSMDMDPQAPDTLHVGLGDFVDVTGGHMTRTTNGGQTWSTPLVLSGTYPAGSGGLTLTSLRIRHVKVDPANSNIVLVGTDVGLFRSTNGGVSYALVDLPNAGTQLPESVWTIAFTGTVGGVSRWAASGVYACTPTSRPPDAGLGAATGAAACPAGNPGDIWVSVDGGATWSSRKAGGAIPTTAVGRITLAAGTPSAATPPVTVLYAQLGTQDEAASDGAGYWRSTDSGNTFVNATGTLTNPTFPAGDADCETVNVNWQQAWYNAAIAVDPQDNNRVLVGGMLCGLRTNNGLAASPTWENVSHWLPTSGFGDTAQGTLKYVHADWHRVHLVRIGATVRAFAGVDGGIFWTDNLFTVTPPNISWAFANRGIVTHLFYGVASGDPATGNPFLTYGGLQDNGTRFRDPLTTPTTFNQVIGGDGFGTAASRDPGTGNSVYWGSVNGSKRRCIPSAANEQCNQGGAWATSNPTLIPGCTNEAQPFIVRYSQVVPHPTPNTFLTVTNRGVFRSSGTGGWTAVSTCLTGPGAAVVLTRNLHASPVIDGLYGVALSGGRFGVTSNCQGSTTACTWNINNPLGFDLNGNATIEASERMSFTSMLSFPPGPTGFPVGDMFLAATTASVMQDGATLVPPGIGHLLRTTDRGLTWTPFHGNGTGFDLPNVGIGTVRYDPSDTTNNTIFVGTFLGVYRTTDGGNTWFRYGVGLPLVNVTDMFISRTGALMRIATYGRGLWEIYPSATAERGVSGNGDWDRNLVLDFRDLGAMASRLSTNPSTTTAPFYDWISDMTGTANSIDDNDLVQFLTRFGDHP